MINNLIVWKNKIPSKEKIFSYYKKVDLIDPPPFTKENCKKFVKYIPFVDAEVLTITWILPNCYEQEFDSKPMQYHSYVFGY